MTRLTAKQSLLKAPVYARPAIKGGARLYAAFNGGAFSRSPAGNSTQPKMTKQTNGGIYNGPGGALWLRQHRGKTPGYLGLIGTHRHHQLCVGF